MERSHQVVLFAVATLAATAVVVFAAVPLLVLFGGFLFALVLRGVAEALSRWTKVRYGVCLTGLLILLVVVAGTGAILLGPMLKEQARELATRIPAAARDLGVRFQATGLPPPAADSVPDPKILAHGAATVVESFFEALGAFVVVFFVGVYGAARPGDYATAALGITPEPYRPRVRRILEQVSTNLTRWLLGRLVAMAFVGIASTIAFALLHVPLALALGILAGLLTFIEYAGALLSAVPPFLLAFTKSSTAAIAVLAVFTALHVVEGYVLTPLLARASVRIPPAITLAGQVVLAALVGAIGMTFSTPLLAVGVLAVQIWRDESRRRE